MRKGIPQFATARQNGRWPIQRSALHPSASTSCDLLEHVAKEEATLPPFD